MAEPYDTYVSDQTRYLGSHQGSAFGHAITTGDVTGNGCLDIIVGAPDDYGLLSGGVETDGDHRGGGPFVNTPGRVWVFEGGTSGNACGVPFLDGELPMDNTDCPVRFRVDDAYSDPTGEFDADFGYAVAFAEPNIGFPKLLTGAPGADIPGDPHLTDAGAVWTVDPGLSSTFWSRVDQRTTAASGRRVAGYPPDDDEYFGSSLAYSSAAGLLVGTPGDDDGRGSIDWFEHDGGGKLGALVRGASWHDHHDLRLPCCRGPGGRHRR